MNIRVPWTLLVAVATFAACGDSPDLGGDRRAGGDDPNTEAARFEAGYVTSLTFVGFEQPPALAHVRFENRSDRTGLGLSYEAWLARQDDWTQVLGLRDTLPVPRAAWRILPVGDLRLRVGEGARIETVEMPLDSAPLRLEALDDISSWSSTTGQRETLASAELAIGDGAVSGLLLQQRRARALDTARPDTVSESFIFTDTLGNGLIVLHSRALPDVPASVWAWLDGERVEWSNALLLPLSSGEGSPGRWSLEVRELGIALEIEGFGPALSAASAFGARYRLFPARATLSFGDERRVMSGVRIEDSGP